MPYVWNFKEMPPPEVFAVTHDNATWRQRLTPAQHRVLREHGTERAGTSPLNAEKRAGHFTCAGCDQPLFSAATKFESGTGWPSFRQALDGATALSVEYGFLGVRTEAHCSRCGGHLGHVFDDGPAPTGKRWCMNGVAMNFVPTD